MSTILGAHSAVVVCVPVAVDSADEVCESSVVEVVVNYCYYPVVFPIMSFPSRMSSALLRCRSASYSSTFKYPACLEKSLLLNSLSCMTCPCHVDKVLPVEVVVPVFT